VVLIDRWDGSEVAAQARKCRSFDCALRAPLRMTLLFEQAIFLLRMTLLFTSGPISAQDEHFFTSGPISAQDDTSFTSGPISAQDDTFYPSILSSGAG
jgi:hypothetical protein